MTIQNIKQRADYTFKHNVMMGRHGWLRLTPAYSVKVVEEILERFDKGIKVLDPFSGTGTTALCAAGHADLAVGVELNPFLVWLSRAKVASYSERDLRRVRETGQAVLTELKECESWMDQAPNIHNINRWWDSAELEFLCRLKTAILRCQPRASKSRNLLLVSFCRLMIELSNAAFNHQSMSFKSPNGQNGKQLTLVETNTFVSKWESHVAHVMNSAKVEPQGEATIVPGDSRGLPEVLDKKFDLLITSPPYPNRMSYIRELRPYMYWMGYLKEAREAGELDWQAIGGTWGVATSRLMEWEPGTKDVYPAYFMTALEEVSHLDNKNGKLLANYLAKYFEDIWHHLVGVSKIMNAGGEVHYIIGNSTFYGVEIAAQRIYADMLEQLEFSDVKVTVIRKRNSKKELFEFDVQATKR